MSALTLPHSSPENATRLSGRTLAVARFVWLAFFSVIIVMFALAIPVRWAHFIHPSPTTLANLNALGLSVSFYAAYLLALEVTFSAAFLLIALFILLRRAAEPMALFTAFFLVAFGVGTETIAPTIEALRGVYPALNPWFNLLNVIAWVSLALFFYLFPNGRFVPRWTRWLAVVWFVICIPWNFAIGSALDPLQWPRWLFALVIGGFWMSWLLSQVYRYRRVSNAVERQQTKWVLFAVLLIIALNVPIVVVGSFLPGNVLLAEEQPTPQGMAYMLATWGIVWPAFLLLPIAIAFSILRYRLWDIDFLINRTLVYGALTFIVIGIYVVLVGGFGMAFQGNGIGAISFLAAGLVAVIFFPVRDRLQRGVNHLMYGERDDPYAVLARLRQRLDLALAPESVLPAIAETTAQTLKLPYVAISLKQGEQFVQVAEYRDKTAPLNPVAFPLTYQGAIIGQLDAAPRAANEAFNPQERRLLGDIAQQAGVVAHALRLTTDLQLARERLVTAREEERRRLRRDLHDGFGPKLAGQSLKLEAALDALDADPATTRALLAEMLGESQTIVAEIRRLVYGLRPPALDELGLLGAVREQAAVYALNGPRVTVTAPDELPGLPAAVEVAAYRIVQEALTNVVRHAQPKHLAVTIAMEGALTLRVEIRDDGVGLPPNYRLGVGLTSMRERAEELGGTLLLESSPTDGTRVCAKLPIAKDL